ncbi:MAG: adenylyltransferase/cytidyltransferase family protein [Candidatus Pacearchaeota archaeon]
MKKVLCFGTFDILHEGHKEFFKYARKYGNFLIVSVISDKIVYENKKKYPLNFQDERIKRLEELNVVDRIIKASDNLEENLKLLSSLKPDVVVFGYDQKSYFEKTLRKFLNSVGINPEYKRSDEFAGGIHSSHLRR